VIGSGLVNLSQMLGNNISFKYRIVAKHQVEQQLVEELHHYYLLLNELDEDLRNMTSVKNLPLHLGPICRLRVYSPFLVLYYVLLLCSLSICLKNLNSCKTEALRRLI
jgi:hypothetical protein